MKYLKRFLLITLLTVILISAGFVAWASRAAQPGQAALDALVSDETVRVTQTTAYISFQPASQQPTTGLIFYPGARVDYRAYAPALRQIAAQGYLVALVPVRLNLAFFDIEAGAPALAAFPQITTWAAGGHSLGGTAASLFAQNHPEISAIVFWASYPPDDSLKESGIQALSIYASLDGLASEADIDASRANLPGDAVFTPITGGNHAQFGDYGEQAGDNPASISATDQWQQIIRATADFLKSLRP
ncbi:MAG: alpha/beta hydrolase [Anaerolineales bacterium]|jgi:dienelactone hydrolase|nr:alpha/beta hydrolase [Anaerolineales bacterium]